MPCHDPWERDGHVSLVSAAQEFLVTVVPLNEASEGALSSFLDRVRAVRLPAPVLDAILVRCLAALDRQFGGPVVAVHQSEDRVASTGEDVAHSRARALVAPIAAVGLLEGYLRDPHRGNQMARFASCIQALFRTRLVRDPLIVRAIDLIEHGYATDLQETLAQRLGTAPGTLRTRFREATGVTPRDYIRRVRLFHAARLLVGTSWRIKDVWVAAGYNDASNFNHDFKERFGLSPREYRAIRGGGHISCHLSVTARRDTCIRRDDSSQRRPTQRRVCSWSTATPPPRTPSPGS